MIQSLYSGISALSAHQQLMGMTANNLANVNTVGYKVSRMLFEDALSQTLQAPSAASTTSPGTNGIQIGLGVSMASVTSLFEQGSLQSTGIPSDVAIEGDGFLTVRNPSSNEFYYTRVGALNLDSSGYLVDSAGLRIQGYRIPAASLFASPSLTPVDGSAFGAGGYGDLLIKNDNAVDTTPMKKFTIETSGRVLMELEDGRRIPVAYIALNKFSNPQGMQKAGKNTWKETPASGRVYTGFKAPGAGGMGILRAGYLEQSNVDLGREFTEMIRAQRGLQANSRVITSSDDILTELINLKR